MTRLLSEVGRPGAARGVLNGGDVDATTGRLLSVAELQAALRAARMDAQARDDARRQDGAQPAAAAAAGRLVDPWPGGHQPADLVAGGPDAADGTRAAGYPRPPAGRPWVAAVGAHAGAGASTLALAVADALTAADRPVHLVSCHEPAACGLLFAPTRELGVDASGTWRTGRRGLLMTISRAVASPADGGASWPASTTGTSDGTGTSDSVQQALTVVDVERAAAPQTLRTADAVLIACRADAAGLGSAEQLLEALLDPSSQPPSSCAEVACARPVLLIALGAGRWPGAISVHAGPLTRQLKADSRLLAMPTDTHLAAYGLSGQPLPRRVQRVGTAAARLIDATHRPAPTDLPTPGEQPAPSALLDENEDI